MQGVLSSGYLPTSVEPELFTVPTGIFKHALNQCQTGLLNQIGSNQKMNGKAEQVQQWVRGAFSQIGEIIHLCTDKEAYRIRFNPGDCKDIDEIVEGLRDRVRRDIGIDGKQKLLAAINNRLDSMRKFVKDNPVQPRAEQGGTLGEQSDERVPQPEETLSGILKEGGATVGQPQQPKKEILAGAGVPSGDVVVEKQNGHVLDISALTRGLAVLKQSVQSLAQEKECVTHALLDIGAQEKVLQEQAAKLQKDLEDCEELLANIKGEQEAVTDQLNALRATRDGLTRQLQELEEKARGFYAQQGEIATLFARLTELLPPSAEAGFVVQ